MSFICRVTIVGKGEDWRAREAVINKTVYADCSSRRNRIYKYSRCGHVVDFFKNKRQEMLERNWFFYLLSVEIGVQESNHCILQEVSFKTKII